MGVVRIVLVVAFGAVALGCTDSPTFSDAGLAPLPDARGSSDASVEMCSPDAGCAGPFTTVCETATNLCVECLGDGDCAAPNALGPSCDEGRGYCACAQDADCAGNANGPLCHPLIKACVCAVETQCGSDFDCSIQPYLGGGVRTCQ